MTRPELEQIPGIINIAAWPEPGRDGRIHLMGRRILGGGNEREPDLSKLVHLELREDGSLTESREVIWDNILGIANLEDPRVVWEEGENSDLVCGFTAVMGPFVGNYVPYPAVARVKRGSGSETVTLEELMVLRSLGPGKNVTPFANPLSGNENLYLFRSELRDHELTLFRFSGDRAEELAIIPFVNVPPWGKYRMGTGSPPVWNEEGTRARMIVHGITYDRKKNFYEYTIGLAFLEKNAKGEWQIRVCPEPLINKKDFPNYPQRHPKFRLAYYSTGEVDFHREKLMLLNVGDWGTIFHPVAASRLRACNNE